MICPQELLTCGRLVKGRTKLNTRRDCTRFVKMNSGNRSPPSSLTGNTRNIKTQKFFEKIKLNENLNYFSTFFYTFVSQRCIGNGEGVPLK